MTFGRSSRFGRLMLFMQLDHGAILRKETGHETPNMIRWIVAKPEVIQTGSGRLVPGSRLVGSDLGAWHHDSRWITVTISKVEKK